MERRGRGRPPVNPRLLAPWARRLRALIASSPHVRNRQDLCDKVHIDPPNLYKYEKDPKNPPPLKLLIDIGTVLHVSLDQLYPTKLLALEPTHDGWCRFVESDIGKAMNHEERADMAAVRFRNRLPTLELYTQLLLAYRAFTQPMEEPTTGEILLRPLKDVRT